METNLDLCLFSPCVIWEAHQILKLPYVNSPSPIKQVAEEQCFDRVYDNSTGEGKKVFAVEEIAQNRCLEIDQKTCDNAELKENHYDRESNKNIYDTEFSNATYENDDYKERPVGNEFWDKNYPIPHNPDFGDLEKSLLLDSDDELSLDSTLDLYGDDKGGENRAGKGGHSEPSHIAVGTYKRNEYSGKIKELGTYLFGCTLSNDEFDNSADLNEEIVESRNNNIILNSIGDISERDFIVGLEKNHCERELLFDRGISYIDSGLNVEDEKTYTDLNPVSEPINQNIDVNCMYRPVNNVVSDILNTEKDVGFNLLLGAKKRFLESSTEMDVIHKEGIGSAIKDNEIDFVINENKCVTTKETLLKTDINACQAVTIKDDLKSGPTFQIGQERIVIDKNLPIHLVDESSITSKIVDNLTLASPEVQDPELVRDLTNGGLITTLRPEQIDKELPNSDKGSDLLVDLTEDDSGKEDKEGDSNKDDPDKDNTDSDAKTTAADDDQNGMIRNAVDTYFKNQMIHSFINRTVFNTILGNRHIQQQQQAKEAGIDENWNGYLNNQYTDIVTSDGRKEFRCNICTTVLPTKSKLRVHMRRHSTHKPYKCPTCDRRFGFKSHLSVHIRTHTGEKPFKCDKCGKPFTNNGDLTRHERTHTGEKPYQCNICGKKFSTNGTLTVHTRRHTGERPYECKYCGKLFTNNSDLSKHERTHRGTKSFKCNACGQNFMSKSDLTKHERTYTGERPFKCTFCGKRFTTNGSLTVHTRTHTGEKPYTCTTCGKQFHSNSNLTVHLKSHARIKDAKRNV